MALTDELKALFRDMLEMASLREQMTELDTEIANTKAQIDVLEKCSK